MSFAPILVAVTVLLHSTGDASTTWYLLGRGARERNPIPRRFFKRLGHKKGLLVYFPLQALFLYLAYSAGYSALIHDFGVNGAGWIMVTISAVLATVPAGTNVLAITKLRGRPNLGVVR